jgi:hypothetical protein
MLAGRELSFCAEAGVRKPPRKEPAGAGRAAWRVRGFGRATACVRDALAGVGASRLTLAVTSLRKTAVNRAALASSRV